MTCLGGFKVGIIIIQPVLQGWDASQPFLVPLIIITTLRVDYNDCVLIMIKHKNNFIYLKYILFIIAFRLFAI